MNLKIAIDYGIMGLLTVMSIISLAVAMERFFIYRRLDINDFKDKKSLEIEITKNLHLIATIGSNAPYIGLLGTVLGIMLTFQTMGKVGFMDSAQVMSGLALALKSTAVGLLVAIPAIIFYNFLLRKAKVLVMKWEIKNG
jgi:biopolymer transport protein ExbB